MIDSAIEHYLLCGNNLHTREEFYKKKKNKKIMQVIQNVTNYSRAILYPNSLPMYKNSQMNLKKNWNVVLNIFIRYFSLFT